MMGEYDDMLEDQISRLEDRNEQQQAEIERLRASLRNIVQRGQEPLPSERNKVTYWKYMAIDMVNIASKAIHNESDPA